MKRGRADNVISSSSGNNCGKTIDEAIHNSDPDSSEESTSDSYNGDSNDLGSEIDSDFPVISREKIEENSDIPPKKLEPDYHYEWLEGEKKYDVPLNNEILLLDKDKKAISETSIPEIFEYFFSSEIKEYIVEATKTNGYNLTIDRFDIFLSIILFSTFNGRLSHRDYWSKCSLVRSNLVADVMSLKEFESIQSRIKLFKPEDKNLKDNIWPVRRVLEIFKKNILKFGYFSTALSINEMMFDYSDTSNVKRRVIEPDEFGIKMWGLCSANGYLFDCDIDCFENSESNSSSENDSSSDSDSSSRSNSNSENNSTSSVRALNSQVAMKMLKKLLTTVPPKNHSMYHIYFNDQFCSPDLIVHLKKQGLRATGVIRNKKNYIDEKAPKGTYAVKHDKESGMNFVSIKGFIGPFSALSTSAGITPLNVVKFHDLEKKQVFDFPMPSAFTVYKKFVRGGDIHDQRCSEADPVACSKKWSWIIFIKILQASVANGVILLNMVNEKSKKIRTYEFTLHLTKCLLKEYL